MTKSIGIGLVGCGIVGTGLLQQLKENASAIEGRLGVPLDVRRIAVRDTSTVRSDLVPREKLTTDPMELLHSHAARAPTPAHTRDPAVPPVLSDIIQRLLAKAAEDRYQSAAGLRADLSECLLRLLATGHIEPFPLARHERGRQLRLAQRLHGRQAALASLLAGWRRVARGSCELLLLSGPSGVGKSALVDAMRLELDREGAYFIAGKCDQLNHGTPYAPLERAFQALVRRALTEPRDVLEALQARLLTALGPNGRVVADLVPALDLLIGAQPPVPGLGPAESRNRLNLVFQRFLAAFAAPQRPLTLFLDDLQWADPATLKLLTALLTDPAGAPLLVIGACRDAELGDDHPLALALAQLRASGCPVTTLTLAPLVDAEVAALVGDTLECPPADVAPLAALISAGHEIAAVYSQPPRPAGRGQDVRKSPVQLLGEQHGLPVRHPVSLKTPEAQAEFAALNADIAVVAAYGLILPQAVLDAPRLGCLNIHASLLPRWRGAAPIQRAILAGDAESGVCIMQMEAGLDTGPVRATTETSVADKTTGILTVELAELGAELMVRVLDDFDAYPAVPQVEEGVTYAAKIDKAETRIDFSQHAEQVERQIRAFNPFPGAWFGPLLPPSCPPPWVQFRPSRQRCATRSTRTPAPGKRS